MRHTPISAAVLLSLVVASAQAGQPATPAAMTAYANQLLDAQKIASDGPGVTVLVARGDQLLYKGARGMASIELGVPMQPDHLLRIGSVTKQFAAAALLKQIDEGKARLDDPISRFLPDYPNGSKITLLHLLNHTSGVKSYTGIPGYMGNPVRRDLGTAELIKEFKDLPVDFQPGEKWAYNNSGYVLLGAVVEAISGKSWHQSIDELLLQPVRITGVHYQAGDRLFKGMAQGYTLNAQAQVAPAGYLSMTQPHAAGALIANAEGLWHWNQALHGGKLISAASYQRMTTPEGPAQPVHYGFGIATATLRGQPMLTHGGGIHGFVSVLDYLPQSRTTVVILRNSDGPGLAMETVARKLAAFAVGEPFAPAQAVAVPAEQLKSAEGVYAREDKQSRMLRVKDGVLHSQRSSGGSTALIALGGDRFAFPDSLTEMQIERGADGKAVAARVFNNGEKDDAERWVRSGELPSELVFIPLSAAQMQALVGSYVSPQFSVRVFVDEQGRLQGQAPGQPAFELKASTPRRVHVPQVDAQLDFSAEEGQAASVTLLQGGNTLVMARK
ncbi:CubicO group peptidase (beta-lactamase class C family) [Pelomonas saccharophila]|uniref:CubicO group peptidase (Beta-lactamase class C family) n=1 Tax=Roseateles saccharophilus TaxID=304 RepID=A0ABU1YIT0_ROSSA|nr:serine hydrolase domain-containing protein [Roseateles saccharophilus]MDR7268757.1 CubicO group peptidase (beta-lactamase class C family) [Roseateles saccharophilus]